MALNSYLKLTGESLGAIKGSVTQAGREDSIEVYSFSHEVSSPRDAASGLPTGKRQHGAIKIDVQIDKATPLLFQMLVNNENIKDWRLDFWKPSRSGKEEQYFTVELVNASVADINQYTLDNKYLNNMQITDRIKVSFCYQKITWTYQDGGFTAEDDWETPVQ